MSVSRRRFLATSAAAGTLGGSTPLVAGLGSVSQGQAVLPADTVKLRPEIEPLVQLIENTDRSRLMQVVGERIRGGLSYREVLTALLLAGVRNVQPRPSVGFKFHAVLVVNSAHIASLAAPEQDRWLPILWALDEFKSSQARDVQEGNWTMSPVDESGVPSSENLRDTFRESMKNWDVQLADVSAAGVARHLGAGEALELFSAYAARDFRSIGHKPIFLANAWRTLQTIGWQHSEPVLRSLAYAMLNHNGEPNPSQSDLAADRSWRVNHELQLQVREDWELGRIDDGAVSELVSLLHAGSPEDASRCVVEQLNSGVSFRSIYDGLHLAAGELLMRQAGIVSLHASTTTNALHFLFDHSASPSTRLALLLQNASFLPQFRDAMKNRGAVNEAGIHDLKALDQNASVSLESIFSDVGKVRQRAGEQVLTWLENGNSISSLTNAARRLVFLKGNDSHDYKFSSAVLEDCMKLSPQHRNRFMAASSWMLQGSSFPTNSLVDQIREALG